MRTSKLQLRSMHRPGRAGAHERFTYDFIVDGVSLAEALDVRTCDLVGCFDVVENSWNTHAAEALLLDGSPDIAPDRVMVFVCPQCADLGCGALTVRVTCTSDEVIWSDFQYENDYDPDMTPQYHGLGPFRFAAEDYRSILRSVTAR
jgi:hypothetical protein